MLHVVIITNTIGFFFYQNPLKCSYVPCCPLGVAVGHRPDRCPVCTVVCGSCTQGEAAASVPSSTSY